MTKLYDGVHAMVDLETLGTGPRAPILSIGAVTFSRRTVHEERSFYRVTETELDKYETDLDTVRFWLQQDPKATEPLTNPLDRRPPLCRALADFHTWYHREAAAFGQELLPIWGYGASFDNPILLNAFRVELGIREPWSHRANMCLRTLVKSFPEVPDPPIGPEHVDHHALHDALSQAAKASLVFQEMWRRDALMQTAEQLAEKMDL